MITQYKDTVTTTNFSDFGSRERKILSCLLLAWLEQGLPNDFYESEVVPMMNRNSGYVFLTNSEFQVAMMNGDKLETFYSCGNCGCEGFRDDDFYLNEEGCNECYHPEDEC